MSIIRTLLESENALRYNIDVDNVMNKLAAIQESSELLDDKIIYTAESVPVFSINQNGKNTYVVECDNLFKLMDSQDQDAISAMDDLKSVLTINDPDINFGDISLLIKDEDIDGIEKSCKGDRSKIGSRIEHIMNYTSLLKDIQNEGYVILVDRK